MIYAVAAILVLSLAYTISATLAFLADEREAHRSQIAELLQRIQAPTQAVYEHAVTTLPQADPAPLPFDDDDAFHKTREELAAELEA